MTIAFWCVFVSGVLPIVWQGYAKFSIMSRFDNANPRVSLKSCEGAAQRATWAHDNSWEAFAPFAAAVIIGHLTSVDQTFLNVAALLFVAMRLLYGICYIMDKATLRSIVWSVGFGCVASIYVAASGIISL